MKKLLHQPLKIFILYALLVLACSIPAYYFIVDRIWLNELDEHNEIIAEKTEKELNRLNLDEVTLEQSIRLWNNIQPGTNLQKATEIRPDCTYTVLKNNPYTEEEDIDRFRGLSRYVHIQGQPYHLTVETNVEETEETVAAIAIITFIFFLILVTGFLLINKKLSVKIWKPFRDTLAKLQAFQLHQPGKIKFEPSDITEFEEMNKVLTRLIEQNIAAYKAQKEFTENASHELQTPLAIVKSKLDILLQSQALTSEQYEIIEEIHKALTRVTRINKNLLLLAKIENQQFSTTQPVDMTGLLNASLDEFSEHMENKNIQLETYIDPHVTTNGNFILVEILFHNLLLNAIRHNPNGGQIIISLLPDRFRITNSGNTALKQEQLFKRFAGASEDMPGSGLGLALVKQICNLHQWEIGYHFHEGLHEFSITF